MSSLARSTDISTSHEAAHYIAAGGVQKDQQAKAAAAVKLHPGMTSMELAKATGLDRHMLGRRLPELLKDHRVWRGAKKTCKVSRVSACTWWPVAPGSNLTLGL